MKNQQIELRIPLIQRRSGYTFFILSALFLLLPVLSHAQEEQQESSDELLRQEAQVTFIHPIGTNGLDAERTINQVSINFIAGVQGGLDGVEMAGVLSVDRFNVRGAQFAGFANLVGKNVDAVQFSGFMNTAGGYVKGAQLSGFLNAAGDSVIGAQGAGFINMARTVQGAQISGFINIANRVKGAQVGGFVNVAKTLSGNQIGFLNVVDSLEKGTPIGFLSFVNKGGLSSFQLSTSDALYFTAGYRTGSPKFYNIIALGARNDTEVFTWGMGYGIGSMFHVAPKSSFGMEFTTFHLNEGEVWTNRVNMLSRLSFPVAFTLFKGTDFVVAPSLNVTVKRRNYGKGEGFVPDIAPYTFFEEVNGNYQVQVWAGLEAGIRF